MDPDSIRGFRSAPPPAQQSIVFNEDQKELHFLCQRIGESASVLQYLQPYGTMIAKLQTAQTEQTKMLGVILACCFDHAVFVPVKGCFTSRVALGAKGLRRSMVRVHGIVEKLLDCFDMRIHKFRALLNYIRDSGMVPKERVDELEEEMEWASDELWADDFRCAVILCRTYIESTLYGRVRPAPEYLDPDLAALLNRDVFDKVSAEDRNRNKDMIRALMKSELAAQLLPLMRVVFHPDLHVWRTALPQDGRRVRESQCEHWGWSAAPAASRFGRSGGRSLLRI